MRCSWLLLLIGAIPSIAEVRVTYLANEGVLLTSGSSKILIDALFRDSLGDYARHDAGTQEALESGKAPFDGVSLALTTHYHLDHWDAGSISRFLRLNPKALFASTPQATGMMPRSQRERVRPLWPDVAGGMRVEVPGVHVEAFPLNHGETQNLGFAVTIDDRRLVHLGDAEASAANFERLLKRDRPDVALIPFWWLLGDESRRFVVEQWKPRYIVAIHFGAADLKAREPELRKALPQAWLCARPGESRTY